jgi:hypothetical protein
VSEANGAGLVRKSGKEIGEEIGEEISTEKGVKMSTEKERGNGNNFNRFISGIQMRFSYRCGQI